MSRRCPQTAGPFVLFFAAECTQDSPVLDFQVQISTSWARTVEALLSDDGKAVARSLQHGLSNWCVLDGSKKLPLGLPIVEDIGGGAATRTPDLGIMRPSL